MNISLCWHEFRHDGLLVLEKLSFHDCSATGDKKLKVVCPHIVDLSPLSGLHNLELLDLSHTQVLDLSPLRNLKKLASLNLEDTHVSDLSPLVGLKALKTIILGPKVLDSEVKKLRRHNPNLEFR